MKDNNRFIWVIRSAGERTKDACIRLIMEFAKKEDIFVVEKSPFSNALKECFEIAENSNADWMICIDADTLIYKEGILKLMEVALKADEEICYVQGLTIDKFIPIYRSPGNGIYRNSLAKEYQTALINAKESIRPETAVMQEVLKLDYKMLRTKIVVGIHDYHQWYRDIYRKIFTHTRKHQNIIQDTLKIWEALENEDTDFQVAIASMKVSNSYRGFIDVHKNFRSEEAQKVMYFLGLKEKEILDVSRINDHYIHDILRNFRTNYNLQMAKFPEYTKDYLITSNKKTEDGSKFIREFISKLFLYPGYRIKSHYRQKEREKWGQYYEDKIRGIYRTFSNEN